MKNLTIKNIAAVTGGICYGLEEKQNLEVSAVVTDSRKAQKDCLFAAIKGERADGHHFVRQVCQAGGIALVENRECLDFPGAEAVLVSSTLDAIKKIAAFYLRQLAIPVVGIVGSVGKTSTKELTASVLSRGYRVLKTEGNFNNELGVPLTIFRLTPEDQLAVLEMGINHFGEMHRLAEITCPETVVFTNIGYSHLEFLGSRDGILKAKSEVFDFIRPGGHIILNGDDDKLITVQDVHGIRPVFYGIKNQECTFRAREIRSLGFSGSSFVLVTPAGEIPVTVPAPGIHMVYNALAAAAAGITYGLTLEQVRDGIAAAPSLSGRFQVIRTDYLTIVDDCYNANPGSMKASLGILGTLPGRRVAILGDMGELGENTEALHREVGSYAGKLRLDLLCTVGTLSRKLAEAAAEENPELSVRSYDRVEELLDVLQDQTAEQPLLQKNDTVLVKASHFMNFGRIVEALKNYR
ncbi:UDP-N-acetylmuramoyl-tripeptide--D-alanyl-D-alanine ligase [Bilifractor porci]|uniref:UDP-N-acetylmuramoyl-tripeptide--D-alanyl-D-alanine ligase n=1 Tax=Bilifractor porci TaxID=2606636 RepID=A0A7X2P6W5_9FIRM|nr:UDP-N-acetylmuramoyl-tripeptide--D-alanyl-D-alanine ligase [Bilifractor porci]MST81170.1 UDP-N-acetylmuramoyl-tripeptide--D-alanyl-D-alanine ligase [Bilifractor porci]